jgi:hypothetical protein
MAEFTPQTNPQAPSALDLRSRLSDLFLERALAEVEGLDRVEDYMEDLESEIASTRIAWVGMAVTEIATLRAELFGPQQG